MQVLQAEGTIYMVLEYGDIDLARLLAKHEQARKEGGGGGEIDENFIRLYWQQMLQVGVHCCSMTYGSGSVLRQAPAGRPHTSVTGKVLGAPDSMLGRRLLTCCDAADSTAATRFTAVLLQVCVAPEELEAQLCCCCHPIYASEEAKPPGAFSDAALQAVHTIHEARIVHSDLKPANFLMVEGQLKLIDFGIAKAISSDTTSIARESQVRRIDAACRSLQALQEGREGQHAQMLQIVSPAQVACRTV